MALVLTIGTDSSYSGTKEIRIGAARVFLSCIRPRSNTARLAIEAPPDVKILRYDGQGNLLTGQGQKETDE